MSGSSGLLGCPGPPQGEGDLMGRTSAGLRPPCRAPRTPRLGRGRLWPHPQVPGPPPRPAPPACCGYCDIDTTVSEHRDKEDPALNPLMPHQGETSAQSSRVTLPLLPTAAAAPQLDRNHAPLFQSQTEDSRTNSPSHSFANSL